MIRSSPEALLATVCPHCGGRNQAVVGQVTHCSACALPFLCIDACCASVDRSECRCWDYLGSVGCLGTEQRLSVDDQFPICVRLRKEIECHECGHGNGLTNLVIQKRGDGAPRPFAGHFIVPLERCDCMQLFHGTSWNLMPSIAKLGLMPPRTESDKRHGFPSEKSLRYAGRDIEAAKSHTKDGCIIQLSYSGLIAITSLRPHGMEINLLFSKMPVEVGGIQFCEDGRSVAFRPEASVVVTSVPPDSLAAKTYAQSRFPSC